MNPPPRSMSGFSLVEMTVVLIIVSLLLGGLFLPLTAQQDAHQTGEADRQLSEVRDALVGYAQINGRLPCPALSATDGRENRDAVTRQCATLFGFVPWVELGVRATDPWSRLLRYRVSSEFVQSGIAGSFPSLTTASAAQLKIQGHNPDNSYPNLTNDIPREVVFVVLSHGKNGYHGTQNDGTTGPSDSGINNPDEDINRDALANAANTAFINRTPTPPDATTLGGFDDLVVWVPRSVMVNRLVAAGKL